MIKAALARNRRRLAFVAALMAGVTAPTCLGSSYAGAATTSASCTRYASPSGSDSAPGTATEPFATVQRLADSLSPGETGCVRGGVYTQDVKVEHGGEAGAPLTITSYPGERAELVGRLWVPAGSNYVSITDMSLDGKNSEALPSPTVNGDHASFVGDDVTNEHTEICFLVGSSWGHARYTLIRQDRIHDCGRIPSTNQDHGIYVDEAEDTQITENVIYHNTDRGIQLYPDAQGTVIEHNIIDANGEGIIFSGDGGVASDNTTVRDNLITNATIRYDVESWYPSGNPVGTGNVVEENCVWSGADGTIDASEGFLASGNTTANPEYADPAAGDYRVSSASPCAPLISGSAIPAAPFSGSSTSGDTYSASSSESTSSTTTSSTAGGETTEATESTETSETTTATETSAAGETTATSESTEVETSTEITTTSTTTHGRKASKGGKGKRQLATAAVVNIQPGVAGVGTRKAHRARNAGRRSLRHRGIRRRHRHGRRRGHGRARRLRGKHHGHRSHLARRRHGSRHKRTRSRRGALRRFARAIRW